MSIDTLYIYLLDYAGVLSVAALLICLILFGFLLSVNKKAEDLKKRYILLTGGKDGKSLEGVITGIQEDVKHLISEDLKLSNQMLALSKKENKSLQGIGLVRFNAFLEIGGEMSFAVALVNNNLDGVLITGIYGREETRTYAKTISSGKCNYRLMNEEQDAVKKAIQDLN